MENLQKQFLIMCGPNVIESEEHTISMAKKLKNTFNFFFMKGKMALIKI